MLKNFNLDSDITEKELHPKATLLIKNYAERFETALYFQAKLLAYHQKADIVLTNHIDEALTELNNNKHKQSWLQQLFMFIGSALFGAFVQGFISELWNGNSLLLLIYTILGFIGIFLVSWVLYKQA